MDKLPRPDQITAVLIKLRAAETEAREYVSRAYRCGDYDVLFEAARRTWYVAGEKEGLKRARKTANAIMEAFASEKPTPAAGYQVPTYGQLTEAVDRLCTAYERAIEAIGND